MRSRFAITMFLVAALVTGPCAAASAGKEKHLGAFGAWHAYTYDEGGQTVCYMVTTKTLKSKGPPKRGTPYLMITHRPVEASIDVFSYGAGTMLDSKHGVRVQIDKATFDFFSVRDNAWARDALTDHKVARAIIDGTTAHAYGLAAEGRMQTISDKFDLAGALPAYRAISKACGLPDIETKAVKKAVKKTEAKKAAIKKDDAKKQVIQKAPAKKTAPKPAASNPKKTVTHPKM